MAKDKRTIKGGIELAEAPGRTFGPGDEDALYEVMGPSAAKHLKDKGVLVGDWSGAKGEDPKPRPRTRRMVVDVSPESEERLGQQRAKAAARDTSARSESSTTGDDGGDRYASMSKADLKAEAEKRGVEVKRRDGKDGSPLVDDYQAALADADRGAGGGASSQPAEGTAEPVGAQGNAPTTPAGEEAPETGTGGNDEPQGEGDDDDAGGK